MKRTRWDWSDSLLKKRGSTTSRKSKEKVIGARKAVGGAGGMKVRKRMRSKRNRSLSNDRGK